MTVFELASELGKALKADDKLVRLENAKKGYEADKDHEPYVRGGYTPTNGMVYEVEVTEGTIFVMGDNRRESLDSRILGPLSLDSLVGR